MKFLIALITGLIITVVDFILTSTYSSQSSDGLYSEVYYGISAIIGLVKEFGILSLAKLFVGKFILYFISNILGLYIFERLRRVKN